MKGYLTSIRRFSPSVWYYLLSGALIGFAYFGISGVLFNLYLLRLGFDLPTIGLMNGVGLIAWAICALPAALVGQRFGLKGAQVIGMLIVSIGQVCLLSVERLPASIRETWLYGMNIFVWVGAALITVNGLPYLLGITGSEERMHALAISSAIPPLFAFLGSLLAGALPGLAAGWTGSSLDQTTPFRITLWLTPVCYFLATWANARMRPFKLEEQDSAPGQSPAAVPLALFLFFGLLIFLQTGSDGAVRVFFNVHLDTDLGVPTAQIGVVMGLASLLPILGALAMPSLIARWGSRLAFLLGSLAATFVMLFLAAVPQFTAAALGFIGLSVLGSFLGGVRGALSQEIVLPRWRATTSAILILGMALSGGSMSILGGVWIKTIHFSGLACLGAVLALSASLLTWAYIWLRSRRPHAAPVPSNPSLEESINPEI